MEEKQELKENTKTKSSGFGGHPKGLLLASIATGINSYAKYLLVGFTVLFYTLSVAEGGLGLDAKTAGNIMAISGAIASIIPLLGSVITDRYLGIQKGMFLGFLLSGIAYMCYFFFAPSVDLILIALTVNIIAGAFINNNVTAVVGLLYSNKDMAKKDAAYSIFYMAVNIGAMLGPIIGGLITDKWLAVRDASGNVITYGYKYAYLAASVGMLLMVFIFFIFSPKWLKDVGKYPAAKESKTKQGKSSAELSPADKKRVAAMIIIFLFVVFYWSAYFQTQSTITIFTYQLVDLNVFGFAVPVSWLISFNGVLCVVLSPLLGMYWVKRSQSAKGDWAVTTKMATGMIITGIAFFIMLLGLMTLNGVEDGSIKMNISFMLLAYFVLTVGELLVSPIGMALFSKLTPARYSSLGMSAWYLCYFFSSIVSGRLLGVTETWGYTKILILIGGVLVLSGVVMIFLKPTLEELMSMKQLESETDEAVAES